MDSVIWLILLWVFFMYVGGAWGETVIIDSTHNGIGDYKSRNTILRGASALQYLAAWLQLTTARNG